MTVLRCSQKLLKRLKQPAKPPESAPQHNPLGEWCADIDFIDREPFAVMMNAATGLMLVLPGHAEFLKRLHLCAHSLPAYEVALRMLDTPFRRKDLGKDFHLGKV